MIIPLDSNFRRFWQLIILMVLTYTALVTPLRISFPSDNLVLMIMDLSTDFLFLIDIVVNFHLAYEDKKGKIIFDKKKIGLRYLKSWFIIDLISSFPMELVYTQAFTEESNSQYIQLNNIIKVIKIFKISRLTKINKMLNSDQYHMSHFQYQYEKFLNSINFKHVARVYVKIFLSAFLLVHFSGCLWLYMF